MQLWRNDAGAGFTDVAPAQGLAVVRSDAVVGDLDRDGDQDLVTAQRRQFGYRLNTGGRFGPEVRIGAVPSGGTAGRWPSGTPTGTATSTSTAW